MQERAFKNLRLEGEEVAEFAYRPWACTKTYRMVVIRKNLAVGKGQQRLFEDYRYFFYFTNDGQSTPAAIVFRANDRCNQENLHAQVSSEEEPRLAYRAQIRTRRQNLDPTFGEPASLGGLISCPV